MGGGLFRQQTHNTKNEKTMGRTMSNGSSTNMQHRGVDRLRKVLQFTLPDLACELVYKNLIQTMFVEYKDNTISVDSANLRTNYDATWDEVNNLTMILPDCTKFAICATFEESTRTRDMGVCSWTSVIDGDLLEEWCTGLRYDKIVLQYDMRETPCTTRSFAHIRSKLRTVARRAM